MSNTVKNSAIECLKSYRAVINAEKNSGEELIALDRLIDTMKSQGKTQEFDYLSPAKCELRTIEEYQSRRAALKARNLCLMAKRRAIERSLEALSDNEQKILNGLFLETPEHSKNAFDLMDSLGIEKTHLYRLRSKALTDFARNMFGT